MSDVMLLGVLRMPVNENDPMCMAQFVSRAREAADRIESDADEITRLQAENEALREGMRKVNATSERHEREMYLAKDEAEALRAALEDIVNQVERDTAMGLCSVTSGCIEAALDALERQYEGGE